MNSLAFVAFFAALTATYAAPSGTVVQGPSARSTVVGVDRSIISSVAPGGQIIAEEHPGFVAHTAPVHVAPVVSSYSHVAPAVVSSYSHAAPAVVSSYSHAAPAVVSSYHAAPVVSHAVPFVAHAAPVVSHAAPVVAAHSAYAYSAPIVAPAVAAHSIVDTVVAGPSGTIATSKTVATPAVVAEHGIHAYAAHGYGHGLYY